MWEACLLIYIFWEKLAPAYFLTRKPVPAYYLVVRSLSLHISWYEKPVSSYCLCVRSISLHILNYVLEKPVSLRIIFLWEACPCIFLTWKAYVYAYYLRRSLPCPCIFWKREACFCVLSLVISLSLHILKMRTLCLRIVCLWEACPGIFLTWEACVCVLSSCEKLAYS